MAMSAFLWRVTVVLGLGLAVTGCVDFQDLLGTGDDDEPLVGERIPVMVLDTKIQQDRSLADLDVQIPPPVKNVSWAQAGGVPSHAMHHLASSELPQREWEVSIGEGTGGEDRLMAAPIIGDGRIYTIDSEAMVAAFDATTGAEIWSVEVLPEEEEEGNLGGGIAFDQGRLYVTTGAAESIALDAATGGEIWRVRMRGPIRAAPTVYAGRVFAVTIDSQLQALDATDGREMWSHAGITELASILGYASPAADGNTLIAVYPSGEIFAFRIDTGRTVWNDALVSLRRVDAISSLSTIRGQPVIYDNQVYVIGHSGRMVAIDLRTGGRVWEQDFGGIETPWVAGDFIFVLTNNAELVAIARRNGGIRWVRPLPLYDDPEDRTGPIMWSGPVLAGDRLIVAGNNEIMAAFSPYTAELLGTVELDDGVAMSPVVADGTIYFLTEDAELIAYR
ncbi:MAG: PQQ-binding-like beta-propeller repeat protein [Alphaproteobacteria bacterium]|nr:PQQ-binding-like beta-propeller repeat protein [Alphaproteobacteria bacterium]